MGGMLFFSLPFLHSSAFAGVGIVRPSDRSESILASFVVPLEPKESPEHPRKLFEEFPPRYSVFSPDPEDISGYISYLLAVNIKNPRDCIYFCTKSNTFCSFWRTKNARFVRAFFAVKALLPQGGRVG
jgi:hypothetical protein